MSSKTIPKAHAMEKVGNFVIGDGKLQVIEYSDLPESLAQADRPRRQAPLQRRLDRHPRPARSLHRAPQRRRPAQAPLAPRREEGRPTSTTPGNPVKPDKPNAVKLEQFVFDAIPLAKNPIVYETDRARGVLAR